MTKLYENCQRMVCAAYANEMADACVTLGIDAWEVSQAAASKPFGYIPFSPGPGVGGHCIPVNPYYLLSTCSMPILEHATKNSWERPTEITKRFMDALFKDGNLRSPTKTGKLVRPRVLVVGVGFKRGQSVMSNSPGVSIISALLSEWDVHVEFADPLVPAENLSYVPKFDTTIHWNRRCLGTFNGIIVAVDQIGLEMSMLDQLPGVTVHDYSKFSRSQAVQSTGKGIRSDLARVFI
jgi:nucleotide sugar dehydrogenase